MRHLLLISLLLLTANTGYGRCSSLKTLSSDLTIDINDPSSFNTIISSSLSSTSVLIDKDVLIPSGITLTIIGVVGNRLNVQMKPGHGFDVQAGGLLIIEYCDLESEGTCGSAGYTNTTWDGVLVYGDPDEDHYDAFDLTGGWDPYAKPFVAGGTYRSNGAGGFAHGRAQIRWCSFRDIKKQSTPSTPDPDNTNTPFMNENAYGNYAIRSTEGGILNVIACDFKDVRIGVLIDHYERYPTDDPNSKFMNAFQIVDCDFTVTSTQRINEILYRSCIELYKAQKVTIEGCTFSTTGTSTNHTNMGIAVQAYESSVLMHKSGNFRRTQDFISGEGRTNCPLYGNDQSNLSGYDANHPWKTNTPRKCEFNDFFRAVHSVGKNANIGLYKIVLDDCVFENNYYSVYAETNEAPTISRCSLSFDESNLNFSEIANSGSQHFPGSTSTLTELGNYDRLDIVFNDCRNALISECTFFANYDGLTSFGKTNYIGLVDQKAGAYNDSEDKYIYDLIYNCTFSSGHAAKDIGIWIYTNGNSSSLSNCNTFSSLKSGIAIAHNQCQLKRQFHYTDMKSGRDASPNNTFNSNSKDFWFPPGYTEGAVSYYLHTSETAPTENGTGNLSTPTAVDKPDCDDMTCEEFPMTSIESIDQRIDVQVYPNPSSGEITILFDKNLPSDQGQLFINDMAGKTIYQRSVSLNKKIQPKLRLDNGIYFVTLVSENGSVSKKIVISK